MANKDINNITLPVFKRVEELRHIIEELKNNDLELQEDIILQEGKAIKSGDNSIVVNSENDEIVLSGLVRADNDVELEQDLIVDGDISGSNITGDSIIENMSGYSYTKEESTEEHTINYVYCSVVKNGNKLTLVWFIDLVYITGGGEFSLGNFIIPNALANKIYPIPFSGNTAVVDFKSVQALSAVNRATNVNVSIRKYSSNHINLFITNANTLTANTHYMIRVEETFLLSDNLTPSA